MDAADKQTSGLEEKYKSVLETIKLYPDQIKQAWDEVSALDLPRDYADVLNVVVCGMGGSALGARMVDSLTVEKCRIPVEIFNDYRLPYYAYKKTLVISSSYSGTTEETLEGTHEAISRGVKLFGLTAGGRLADIFRESNTPFYQIDPKFNPSGQPRMAIGYSFGAIVALLAKLKVIEVLEEELEEGISAMRNAISEYEKDSVNLAKNYASELKGKIPIIVASEHLVGTMHTVKNQFNESAKTFSALYELPELNHHLMEGLTNPKKLREVLKFFFVNSDLYGDRIKKRYPLTAEVVEKNGVPYLMYKPFSKSKLAQVFEVLVFGSFVVYYLSKDYEIDPTVIPWVDYFKAKLSPAP